MAYTTFSVNNTEALMAELENFLINDAGYTNVYVTPDNYLSAQAAKFAFKMRIFSSGADNFWGYQVGATVSSAGVMGGGCPFKHDVTGQARPMAYPLEVHVVATARHFCLTMQPIASGYANTMLLGVTYSTEVLTPAAGEDMYFAFGSWTSQNVAARRRYQCLDGGADAGGLPGGTSPDGQYLFHPNSSKAYFGSTGYKVLNGQITSGKYIPPYNYGYVSGVNGGYMEDITRYMFFDESATTVAIPLSLYYCHSTATQEIYQTNENPNILLCNGKYAPRHSTLEINGKTFLAVSPGTASNVRMLLVQTED